MFFQSVYSRCGFLTDYTGIFCTDELVCGSQFVDDKVGKAFVLHGKTESAE